MRGQNSRIYYRDMHNARKTNYVQVVHFLNSLCNDKSRPVPTSIQCIIDRIHKNKLPEVSDMNQLVSLCQNDSRTWISNVPSPVLEAYSKSITVLDLSYIKIIPKQFKQNKISKQQCNIFLMDNLLRQNNTLENLSPGDLRYACFIRGMNGYEPDRSDDANRFWLKSWLKITSKISTIPYKNLNESEKSFYSLSLVIWSTNFSNYTYVNHINPNGNLK